MVRFVEALRGVSPDLTGLPVNLVATTYVTRESLQEALLWALLAIAGLLLLLWGRPAETAIALAPLVRSFGVRQVVATSLQALSGAGRSPGVHSMDILDNVIPYIPGEEEKVQKEAAKILGRLDGDTIVPLDLTVSATCTRVQVRDGHTVWASVALSRPASLDEVSGALSAFAAEFCDLGLPSAPEQLIHVTQDPYHPQPRVDRQRGDGMVTTIGRLREDRVLPNGVKFVLLSHNTKMGAAKGAVLTAELLVHQGLA